MNSNQMLASIFIGCLFAIIALAFLFIRSAARNRLSRLVDRFIWDAKSLTKQITRFDPTLRVGYGFRKDDPMQFHITIAYPGQKPAQLVIDGFTGDSVILMARYWYLGYQRAFQLDEEQKAAVSMARGMSGLISCLQKGDSVDTIAEGFKKLDQKG